MSLLMLDINIGVNRPNLGGTVPLLGSLSRCPALTHLSPDLLAPLLVNNFQPSLTMLAALCKQLHHKQIYAHTQSAIIDFFGCSGESLAYQQ